MKLSVACLVLFASAVRAGSPKVSITINDSTYDGVQNIKPTVAFEGSTVTDDVVFSYGASSDVHPTDDIAALPNSVWGQLTTDVSGWNIKARAEIGSKDLETADFALDASNVDLDASLRVTGNANKDGGSVEHLQFTKGMDVNGARVYLNPRYDVAADNLDIVVGYSDADTDAKFTTDGQFNEAVVTHRLPNTGFRLTASNDKQEVEVAHQMGDTGIKVKASMDQQEVSVSQQLSVADRLSPTIKSNGDIMLEWERLLGEDGKLTTKIKPNDCIDVEWKDRETTANVQMDIDGSDIKGARFTVKRDVVF